MDADRDREELYAAMQELVADADLPIDPESQRSTLRLSTKLWLGATAVCVGVAILGNAWLIFGGIFGAVFFCIALAHLTADLGSSPALRARSETAVEAYFQSVRRRDWKAAFSVLSTIGRERTATVPDIPELCTIPEQIVRDSPAQLRRYWQSIAGSRGKHTRQVDEVTVTPLSQEGHVHTFRVDMRIKHARKNLFLTLMFGALLSHLWNVAKPYTTSFMVTAFKHRSEWWLLTGECASPAEGNEPHAKPLPVARVVK